jgi:C4-dicarboxylate transporter DctM subunit
VNPDLVLFLAFASFATLALLEVPIGIALLVGGALGIVMLDGADLAQSVLGAVPFTATSSYAMFAIPAFIMLGAVISNAGLSAHIFYAVSRMARWLPNGVAVTAVMATTIMSGISGSSAADVATMGRICVNEMQKVGYSKAHAAAVVAASGAFAALIPPAIGLVVYAIVSGESVGDMLLAGIVPGLLSAAALMAFLVFQGWRNPAPRVALQGAMVDRVSAAVANADASRTTRVVNEGALSGGGVADQVVREDASTSAGPRLPSDSVSGRVMGIAIAGVLFVVVIGGIYAGIMTATEAAAVGAVAAIILVALGRRARDRAMWPILKASFEETAHTSAMIFLLLIGGSMVTYLVVASNMPVRLSEAILGLPVPPLLIVALFLIVLIPLGMFLDGLSIMLLTIPIVAPVVDVLGYDGVWFGILFMKMMEIGLITPPVGINCFVVAGVVGDLKVEDVFRKIFPFVVLDLFVTAFLFLTPGVVTWLPELAAK